jgi:hypothetical protein
MFALAQRLCNWHEQLPSSRSNFGSGIVGEVERVFYTGVGPASDFICMPQYVIIVVLHFKWYTLY